MQALSYRAFPLALVSLACLLGDAGCGAKLPPTLPSTEALQRSASRVDLVDLVISDPARAAKVQRLYAEIETIMVDVKRTTSAEIVKLGAENPRRTEAETQAVVARVRDAELAAFRRYVKIQLELRQSMNAEEFAKLDAIK